MTFFCGKVTFLGVYTYLKENYSIDCIFILIGVNNYEEKTTTFSMFRFHRKFKMDTIK